MHRRRWLCAAIGTSVQRDRGSNLVKRYYDGTPSGDPALRAHVFSLQKDELARAGRAECWHLVEIAAKGQRAKGQLRKPKEPRTQTSTEPGLGHVVDTQSMDGLSIPVSPTFLSEIEDIEDPLFLTRP